jgi:6-pyruvoyltetrahydropterin/6-carboxytetrahydropterin synthase
LQKRPFLVVGKIFKFDAAHRLPNYDGPCSRYHGHEYKLEVQVKRRVDTKTNMVMDFSKLKDKVKESVINRFDHYSLNAFFKNPTAESMIKSIWEILMFESQIKGLHQLILWETSDSYCKITDKMFLSIFESDIEPYIQKWGR